MKTFGLDMQQVWSRSPVPHSTHPSGTLFIPLLKPYHYPRIRKMKQNRKGNIGKPQPLSTVAYNLRRLGHILRSLILEDTSSRMEAVSELLGLLAPHWALPVARNNPRQCSRHGVDEDKSSPFLGWHFKLTFNSHSQTLRFAEKK